MRNGSKNFLVIFNIIVALAMVCFAGFYYVETQHRMYVYEYQTLYLYDALYHHKDIDAVFGNKIIEKKAYQEYLQYILREYKFIDQKAIIARLTLLTNSKK